MSRRRRPRPRGGPSRRHPFGVATSVVTQVSFVVLSEMDVLSRETPMLAVAAYLNLVSGFDVGDR
jgi:hypothetical protein